jgi:glutaredoxin
MYVVYGRRDCGYCHRATALLGERRLRVRFHDVRNARNRRRMLDRLRAAAVPVGDPAALTVPQIFRGGAYVGGYDALRRHLGLRGGDGAGDGNGCPGGVCRWAGARPVSSRRRR